MKNTEDIATLEELAKMKRKISPDREITLPVSLANVDSRLDLFFAPEKHEGWANLYKGNAYYHLGSSFFYQSESEAKKFIGKNYGYVGAIKIEWEE